MLFVVPFVVLLSLLSSASAIPLSWRNNFGSGAPIPSKLIPNAITGRDADPVNHGLCSLHVRQVFGDLNGHTKGSTVAGTMTAALHDGWHKPIGDLASTPFDYFAPLNDSKRNLEMTSELPYVLTMEMSCEECRGVDSSHGEHLRIRFRYGAEWWMSNADGYCIEGWADEHSIDRRWRLPWAGPRSKRKTPIAWTRDLDCSFRC